MDRWEDADDDVGARPKPEVHGRVARMGLAGFAKSTAVMGSEGAQTFGKIEVVPSKREQRKTDATRLMPPPPLPLQTPAVGLEPPPRVQVLHVEAGPPKCSVPPWAGPPPPGARLLAYKDGALVQEIELGKHVTVFGRTPELADVVLDHPSISRQHAAAGYHAARGTWMVVDMGSTHGTFVNGLQLAKGEPVELAPGAELRFAASTRRYRLPPPPPSQGEAAPAGPATRAPAAPAPAPAAEASGAAAPGAAAAAPRGGSQGGQAQEAWGHPPPARLPAKRPRVSFADDDADGGGDGDAPAGGGGGAAGPSGRERLEQVIGFTDGRDFVARVGPRAAAPEAGRFAVPLQTTIVVSPKGRPPPVQGLGEPGAGGGGSEAGGGAGLARAGSDGGGGVPLGGSPRGVGVGVGAGGGGDGSGGGGEVQPRLAEIVARVRKEPTRASNLYEQLPPPSKP